MTDMTIVSEDTISEDASKTVKTKGTVSTSVPLDFEAFFEAEAEKLDISTSELLRQILHDKYGYDFPASQQGRRKIYESEEARVAAQKSAATAKNTAGNVLAELLASGKLDLSEMGISQEQIELLKALKVTKTRKSKTEDTPVTQS